MYTLVSKLLCEKLYIRETPSHVVSSCFTAHFSCERKHTEHSLIAACCITCDQEMTVLLHFSIIVCPHSSFLFYFPFLSHQKLLYYSIEACI